MVFALACEWVGGASVLAPSQAATLVRSWWEEELVPVEDRARAEALAGRASITAVQQAMGMPVGIVRPRPGGLAAVASNREHPARSAGEATTP